MDYRPKIRYWLPAAAVDETDLREEIRQFCERGFGGVEVVVLAMLPPEIGRGDYGWGTPAWDHIIDIIANETEKLHMTMDVAAGPGWPIASPKIRDVDDLAALCELTYGMEEVTGNAHYHGALPKRRVIHEEGTPVLVAAMAYKVVNDHVLQQDSCACLMPYLQEQQTGGKNGKNEIILDYTLPGTPEDKWCIFAYYRQPACQRINQGQIIVADHFSRAGADAVVEYWQEILDRCNYPSMESIFCDSLEYQVCLEWTPGLEDEFLKRRGYSVLPYLPFLGRPNIFPPQNLTGYRLDDPAISEMVNNDYSEVLTQLYCEYHLAGLEQMAEHYGKTVRYQVAYNKPMEIERCALYVGIPENEALGRAVIDSQKTMAAAAHLGRKERYSFECAAEFGHSYGQTYEDLLWWVNRSLMAGMNAQVLHGGSYSGTYHGRYAANGYVPGTEWPGFEAFGKFVSNYWNRTPDLQHARGVMETITRLNRVFRKKARVDCAILRIDFSNDGLGSEHYLYPDQGALNQAGYSSEFLSEDLLHYRTALVHNHVLDEDGPAYKVLIIPPLQAMSLAHFQTIESLAEQGLPIIWIGSCPGKSLYLADWNTEEKREQWRHAAETAFHHPAIAHVSAYTEVPCQLQLMGIEPEIAVSCESDDHLHLMTQTRDDEESSIRYYGIYGYNEVQYTPDDPNPDSTLCSSYYRKGTVGEFYHRPGEKSRHVLHIRLHGAGQVYAMNQWDDSEERLDFYQAADGILEGQISIEEGQMLVLAVKSRAELSAGKYYRDIINATVTGKVIIQSLELYSFKPDTTGEKSFLRSHFSKNGQLVSLEHGLKPWKDLEPELLHFSGKGVYHGRIHIEKVRQGSRYILRLGEVSDTFTVKVNGVETLFPDQVLKTVDVTDCLKAGDNDLEVAVVSNLYNCMFTGNESSMGPMRAVYVPRKYGLWAEEGKHIELLERQSYGPVHNSEG